MTLRDVLILIAGSAIAAVGVLLIRQQLDAVEDEIRVLFGLERKP